MNTSEIVSTVGTAINGLLLIAACGAWTQYIRQAKAAERQLGILQHESRIRLTPSLKVQEMFAKGGPEADGKRFIAIGLVNMGQFPLLITKYTIDGDDVTSAQAFWDHNSPEFPIKMTSPINSAETCLISPITTEEVNRIKLIAGSKKEIGQDINIELEILYVSNHYRFSFTLKRYEDGMLYIDRSSITTSPLIEFKHEKRKNALQIARGLTLRRTNKANVLENKTKADKR